MPQAKKAEQPSLNPEAAAYVRQRLAELNDVFTAAAIGDFSKNVTVPDKEDEFTELLVGVQMMVDVIREKISELADVNVKLEAGIKERTAKLASQEKSLEASESYVNQLLNAAPDAIIVADGDGNIVRTNRQAEAIFQYPATKLIGMKVEQLMPQRFTAVHPQHRASYMKEPRTRPMGANLDLYARRKDGTEFPVEISLSPVHRGQETTVIAIIRDITERKKVEQQLRDRAEELEKFNRLMVGRELKMVEMKKELEKLRSGHGQ